MLQKIFTTIERLKKFIRLLLLDYNKVLPNELQLKKEDVYEFVNEIRKDVPEYNKDIIRDPEIYKEVYAEKYGLKFIDFQNEKGPLGYFSVIPEGLCDEVVVSINRWWCRIAQLATFAHEIGHFYWYLYFAQPGPFRFEENSEDIESLLKNREEIFADIIVALGCYPYPVVREVLYGGIYKGWGEIGVLGKIKAYIRAIKYLHSLYNLWEMRYFESPLYNIAATIHYMKLRRTLFEIYGV
ncbi:MAG: hypothetical protein QW561_05375 [Candidatus Aenigmatarchaeota archaeon]